MKKKEDEDKTYETLEELFSDMEKHKPRWYKFAYYKTKRVIEDSLAEIKFAWQRVFRGWDDRAEWSLDHYLAKLIPEVLHMMLKINRGYPVSLYPEGTNFENVPKEVDDACKKKWKEILIKIIEGFEEYRESECLLSSDNELKKFNEGFDLFKKYYQNLWD